MTQNFMQDAKNLLYSFFNGRNSAAVFVLLFGILIHGRINIKDVPPCTTFADVVSIGGAETTSGSLYPSLTDAIFDLTQCGITKPIVLSINSEYSAAAETFPIVIPSIAGSSAANTITIKPAAGVVKTISGNSAVAIFKLNGADHVVIDGSNTNGGSTKNLTIRNTSSSVNSAVIWIASTLTDGATNITVKNTEIFGNSGVSTAGNIVISGSVIGNEAEFSNSNINIISNSLAKAQNGIFALGRSITPDLNWNFSDNTIGSEMVSEKGFRGIAVQHASAFTVARNMISGITSAGEDISSGILIGGSAMNGVINNNKISDIKNTSDLGYGSNGIFLNASTVSSNISVYNNMIWDVASIGDSTLHGAGDNGYGMVVNNGGGYKIYYNSVNMTTNQTRGNSAALNVTINVTTSGAVDVRNNIFANNQTLNRRFAVYSAASSSVFADINFNNYHSAGTLGFLRGFWSTLEDWKIATSKDSNSLNIVPTFVSATDLHLQACGPFEFPAAPISGIVADIDGDTRSVSVPDMGADEIEQNSSVIFTGLSLTDPTLWNLADNWSLNILPVSDKCVVIPAGKTVFVNMNAAAKKITVEAGAKLTVNTNRTLTVENALINNANPEDVVIKSDGNLIQINPSKTVNSGSITVEREITDLRNQPGVNVDYIYWSSPVEGQRTTGAAGFSPGTPSNTFFDYREANDRFYQTDDATFTPGKGYAVRAENNQGTVYTKTYKFTGVANNGDVEIPVTRSVNTGDDNNVIHGYNLVGNPYPSNIDFEKLYRANSGLIWNTAWFWTNASYEQYQQGSSYSGNNYAVYNGTGGNAATSFSAVPSAAVKPNGMIKVGQGFMVQKKNFSTENLSFKNFYGPFEDLRVGTDGVFYYRNDTPKNRFTLQLVAPDRSVNTQLVGYIGGATDDYEKDFDAAVSILSSNLFYSVLSDKRLVIQGKSLFKTQDKVQLGANFFQNGNYTIALTENEGIFATGQNIYLKDKQTGIITDLTQGSYTFTATAGETNARFEIIYEPETVLATDGKNKEQLVVYRNNGGFVIKAPKIVEKVEMYESSGRLLQALHFNGKIVTVDASALFNGLYLLKIQTKDGEIYNKKILK